MGLVFIILTTLACETVPEEIPADISKQVFFKEAQEYIDALNWEGALFYLNEFKRRFPDDNANILVADYQLALMSYKQGQYNLALEGFEAILETYENDVSGTLHEWVRVLSQKLIDRITENRTDGTPEEQS